MKRNFNEEYLPKDLELEKFWVLSCGKIPMILRSFVEYGFRTATKTDGTTYQEVCKWLKEDQTHELAELKPTGLAVNLSLANEKSSNKTKYLVLDFDNFLTNDNCEMKNAELHQGLLQELMKVDTYVERSSDNGFHAWFKITNIVADRLAKIKEKKTWNNQRLEIKLKGFIRITNNQGNVTNFKSTPNSFYFYNSNKNLNKSIKTLSTRFHPVIMEIERLLGLKEKTGNYTGTLSVEDCIKKPENTIINSEEEYQLFKSLMKKNKKQRIEYEKRISNQFPSPSEGDFYYVLFILDYLNCEYEERVIAYLASEFLLKDRYREKLSRQNYLKKTVYKAYTYKYFHNEIGKAFKKKKKIQEPELYIYPGDIVQYPNFYKHLLCLDNQSPTNKLYFKTKPELLSLSKETNLLVDSPRRFKPYETKLLIYTLMKLKSHLDDLQCYNTIQNESWLKILKTYNSPLLTIERKELEKIYTPIQGGSGLKALKSFVELLTQIKLKFSNSENQTALMESSLVSEFVLENGTLALRFGSIFAYTFYNSDLGYVILNYRWAELLNDTFLSLYMYLISQVKPGTSKTINIEEGARSLYPRYEENGEKSKSRNRREYKQKIESLIKNYTTDLIILDSNDPKADTGIRIFRRKVATKGSKAR